MQWYEGLIPEAIALAKKNKALFVVYISGDDDESKKMDQTWLDESVGQTCQNAHCVALRIEAKSDVCQQFAQIYPVIVIPTTFFIGNSGLPLEVVGGYLTPENFIQRIGKVINLHKEDLPSESPPPASPVDLQVEQRMVSASSDLPSASSPIAGSATSSDFAEDGEFFTNDGSLEDKIDRARTLIAEKRKEKEQKKKKDEIASEIERRKHGQDLSKIKRQRDEADAQELADRIAKERVDEKLAREKVLKQIAQDREEKKRRYDSELEMAEKAKEEAKKSRLLAEQKAAETLMISRSTHCRIQFRLPDGSTVTNQFSADDAFIEARKFIYEHVGNSFGNFSLSTTFPRHDFTEEDNTRTFRDLQMVPTAVVILIPVKSLRSYSGDTSGENWFWFLLTPVIFFLNLLKRAVSSVSSSLPFGNNQASQSRTPAKRTETTSSGSQSAYKRTSPSSNSSAKNISRRDGNVHRFTNTDDDKDDNNTWNGNSTQQM